MEKGANRLVDATGEVRTLLFEAVLDIVHRRVGGADVLGTSVDLANETSA